MFQEANQSWHLQTGAGSLAAALDMPSTATPSTIWEHLWAIRTMVDEGKAQSKAEQAVMVARLAHVYGELHAAAQEANSLPQVTCNNLLQTSSDASNESFPRLMHGQNSSVAYCNNILHPQTWSGAGLQKA